MTIERAEDGPRLPDVDAALTVIRDFAMSLGLGLPRPLETIIYDRLAAMRRVPSGEAPPQDAERERLAQFCDVLAEAHEGMAESTRRHSSGMEPMGDDAQMAADYRKVAAWLRQASPLREPSEAAIEAARTAFIAEREGKTFDSDEKQRAIMGCVLAAAYRVDGLGDGLDEYPSDDGVCRCVGPCTCAGVNRAALDAPREATELTSPDVTASGGSISSAIREATQLARELATLRSFARPVDIAAADEACPRGGSTQHPQGKTRMTNAERAALRREVGQLLDRYCSMMVLLATTHARETCQRQSKSKQRPEHEARGALDAALDRVDGLAPAPQPPKP